MKHGVPKLSIREMQSTDLLFAAACTSAEGWVSEDLATLEGFFLHDPQGCFVAESEGKPLGMCIATWYGASGFVGELIVHPEARGKGLGAALLNQAVEYLHVRGAKTVYLDGVLKAVDLYERNGFRKVCRSWRFSGTPAGRSTLNVRRMAIDDLDQVVGLDRYAFGEDRSFFLRRRLEQFPELGLVMVEGSKVTDYILGRGGEGWLSAGPWVVRGNATNPEILLEAFALEARGRPISLGMLDANQKACELARSLGLEARADSPWRMALGPAQDLGASPGCYAVGSAAKG